MDDDVPWLFYHDQVNEEMTSFYYDFTEYEINLICDNIEKLAAELKVKYNIYLILLPIPAKYTVNHHHLNNDKYSNFLPKLYKELDKRGIKHIKLYEEFMNSDELLYHKTDSHWNEKGIELTLKNTVQYFKNDTLYNKLYNN